MEPENSEKSGRDFSRKIPYWWRQSSPNSTPQSCIISILTFAWDKMADSANCWCFQAASRVEDRTDVISMESFVTRYTRWGARESYILFQFKLQRLPLTLYTVFCDTTWRFRVQITAKKRGFLIFLFFYQKYKPSVKRGLNKRDNFISSLLYDNKSEYTGKSSNVLLSSCQN